jgi:hypothetical protein
MLVLGSNQKLVLRDKKGCAANQAALEVKVDFGFG